MVPLLDGSAGGIPRLVNERKPRGAAGDAGLLAITCASLALASSESDLLAIREQAGPRSDCFHSSLRSGGSRVGWSQGAQERRYASSCNDTPADRTRARMTTAETRTPAVDALDGEATTVGEAVARHESGEERWSHQRDDGRTPGRKLGPPRTRDPAALRPPVTTAQPATSAQAVLIRSICSSGPRERRRWRQEWASRRGQTV